MPLVPPSVREAARRALALGDAALLAECRDKSATGVRLAHPATGAVATATERRSQARNRGAALLRLRQRLRALSHLPRPRRPTSPSRRAEERRLAAKRRRGERKAERRGGYD